MKCCTTLSVQIPETTVNKLPSKTPYLVVMPLIAKSKIILRSGCVKLDGVTLPLLTGSNPYPEGHRPPQEFLCNLDWPPSNIHIPVFSSHLFSTLNMHITETKSALLYPYHPPFLSSIMPGNNLCCSPSPTPSSEHHRDLSTQ